jgi:hypothetical protein
MTPRAEIAAWRLLGWVCWAATLFAIAALLAEVWLRSPWKPV